MSERTQALAAAEVAFREELSLANYLRVAEVAGDQWPEQRVNLLAYCTRKIPEGSTKAHCISTRHAPVIP